MSNFVTGASNHRVNNCVLTAINCSELHDDFVKLARSGAWLAEWMTHYAVTVIPVIRKLGRNTPYTDRREVATLLKEYYETYVAENV